jgi:hypothetical protein
MTISAVEIRPEVAMYAAFARLNYRPWYALAEFVDNSLQSYISNRDAICAAHGGPIQLVVSIQLGEDVIEIRDNAAGIGTRDLARAFLPASPPPDTSGLSEFGLGMKAAACWFSKRWSVRTKALGESIERTIAYDIPAITAQHIERLPILESVAASGTHYTIVTLSDLNVHPRSSTIAKIKRHLASIYRCFLRDGSLELRVDDEALGYEPPTFLRASRYDDPAATPIEWYREFSLPLDERHRISGWAGLLNRASVANAGFSVFRRRRLIEGSYGEAYRPEKLFRKSNSYTYQRLVGELHVEGFTVSHTKDGVQWEEWEDDLLAWLRNELNQEPIPLLDQAEEYRARPERKPLTLTRAVTDAGNLLVQRVPPLIDEQLSRPPESHPPPATLELRKLDAQREVELSLSHAGERWHVKVELISDDSVYEWLDIAKSEVGANERFLQIRVNVGHPFVQRFSSPSGAEVTAFVRLAAGLAISEITAAAQGVRQAGTIRRNLNQLLHDALAGPIEPGGSGDDEIDS